MRKGDRRFEGEDVAAVLEDASALTLIGRHVRDIAVDVHCEPNMPPVPMDKVQIQQVLFNLIRNAIEAMAESPLRELAISAVAQDTDVQISIADRGTRLDPMAP